MLPKALLAPVVSLLTLASALALPADSGVINVRDHGAKGDGKTDDTAAITAAVRFAFAGEGRYATPAFIYFPTGTYLVSGPIEGKAEEYGFSGGWRAGFILRGDGPDKSVIKLSDRAKGYRDAANPRWVIATGSESDKRTKRGDPPLSGGGNRAFRHGVYSLTVDVGAGNPGAIAIDYVCSNRGSIENVVIRSSDPQGAGAVGLNMTRNWPGPALVKDVVIDGFDVGIATSHAQYSMTFENIKLTGQRVVGVEDHYAQALFFRKLHSVNSVPVFRLPSDRNLLVLLDSTLEGGAPDAAAIEGAEAIKYLRNVVVEGYGRTIADVPAAPAVGPITEYAHPEPIVIGSRSMPPLAIEESPTFWSDNPDDFANVVTFGATPGGDDDDGPGIQAAIDSGKPIVYLPSGSYRVKSPVVVRGDVRLITGMQSAIGRLDKSETKAVLRFENGSGPVNVEHLWLDGVIENASPRPVALRHVDMNDGYRNTAKGRGDVFFEDTIGKPIRILHPQRVFGRQVNCEFGEDPLIENHGGAVWLFGYKTEGQMTAILNDGGLLELLGGFFYPLRKVDPETPLIINDGGRMRLTYAMNGGKNNYRIQVERTGQKPVTDKDIPGRGPALLIDTQ
jgi:hypothetical protein